MPFAAVKPFATFVARRFKRFNPIFFISGDTHFESPEEAPYYMAALHRGAQGLSRTHCITMHLQSAWRPAPRLSWMPSTSTCTNPGTARRISTSPTPLPRSSAAYPVKRPIVNSEPPYEGHGRIGERTRFNAFDIRKATWQSLLSGAKMGITYGAHGVWSFHKRGMNFLNAHRSFEPFDWDEALYMDGAWDVAFAKHLFETYNLFAMNSVATRAQRGSGDSRRRHRHLSTIAIYSPYAFELELDLDLTGYHCMMFDLASRRVMNPAVQTGRNFAHRDAALQRRHALSGSQKPG